ncbi:MAG: DNA polymerase III subunit delta [Gammaproteobacteria bacterium]
MKLPYQQLAQHVTKTLAPIYLISGDELLLVQEAIDLIRDTAIKSGFTERVRISTESAAEWGKFLYSSAHSLSLFATQRILELDLRGVKLNQASTEILQTYAENPAPDTLLLISIHKLDAKQEQSRWYKALENKGVAIPVWPIPNEQLPQWIMQRAKKINLTLSLPAATWLAQQVEGNLLAAAQEIEKLRLLQTSDVLDEHTLADIISNHSRFDIFNLVDCILSGNSKRSLQILKNLLAEDTEPTLVLWAITRELRTMAEISKQTQQGIALSVLFNKFRIWEKRQPNARAFLKRNGAEQCWKLLLSAAKIDRIIKGAEVGNSWDEFERLILAI